MRKENDVRTQKRRRARQQKERSTHISKSLKEEIKDIAKERPSRKERMREKQMSKAKHAAHKEKFRLFPKEKRYEIILLIMSLAAVFFLMSLIVLDAFPADLTVVFLIAMLVLFNIVNIMFKSRKKYIRVAGVAVALVFLLLFGSITYYLGSAYAMMSQISSGTSYGNSHKSGVDVTEEPFNIYITGIDQWEKEKGEDLERSDVNMIVTVNPRTKKVLLTSIPRDSYVKLHTAQQMDKLTHSGIYGVEETLSTVEDWLGLKLSYYVKMNFSGARDVIEAIDGIDFYNPVEFKSSLRGYTYKKGKIHLNGKRAIYYARERKAFEGKDDIRVENQQRVMKAIINKMTSSSVMLLRYGDIMKATSRNLETNLPTSDMEKIVKMQLSDLATWDVQSQKITGEYDMDYVASLTQSQMFSVYRPDEASVKTCTDAINSVFNPTEEELTKAIQDRNKSFFVNMFKRFFNNTEKEQ